MHGAHTAMQSVNTLSLALQHFQPPAILCLQMHSLHAETQHSGTSTCCQCNATTKAKRTVFCPSIKWCKADHTMVVHSQRAAGARVRVASAIGPLFAHVVQLLGNAPRPLHLSIWIAALVDVDLVCEAEHRLQKSRHGVRNVIERRRSDCCRCARSEARQGAASTQQLRAPQYAATCSIMCWSALHSHPTLDTCMKTHT